jgi:hypothetical protein
LEPLKLNAPLLTGQVESVAAALTGTVDCPPSVYNTNQATEDEPGTGFVETFSGGSTAGSTRGSIRAAGSATGYTKEFGGEITSIKSTGNQELREQNEGISQARTISINEYNLKMIHKRYCYEKKMS